MIADISERGVGDGGLPVPAAGVAPLREVLQDGGHPRDEREREDRTGTVRPVPLHQ